MKNDKYKDMRPAQCYHFLIEKCGEETVQKLTVILHKEGVAATIEATKKVFPNKVKKKMPEDFEAFLTKVYQYIIDKQSSN